MGLRIRSLSFLMLLASQLVVGQNGISGYVNFGDVNQWESKIYLSQLSIHDFGDEARIKPIAVADVHQDGFFKFDKKHLSGRNKIYRLHVNRIKKIINDTIAKEVTFMSSNRDTVLFPKGKQIFSPYFNTNEGDKEWKRLKAFEAKLMEQYLSEKETGQTRKGFVKDSLQILMVKLIGAKQLEKKNLLDKDIDEHPEFYLDLLSELKQSDVDPNEYAFLERKLAYLTNINLEEKLRWSVGLNIALILIIVSLTFAAMKMKNVQRPVSKSPLSRQEATIKNLILEGKTNKEIANELFISLSTVKTHITNIYGKLNVANRQELHHKSTGTST